MEKIGAVKTNERSEEEKQKRGEDNHRRVTRKCRGERNKS